MNEEEYSSFSEFARCSEMEYVDKDKFMSCINALAKNLHTIFEDTHIITLLSLVMFLSEVGDEETALSMKRVLCPIHTDGVKVPPYLK